MLESGGISDDTGKVLTLEDLIAAIDRHEKTPSNVPKEEPGVDAGAICESVLFRGRLKQGSQRRYKTVDQKCRPVPVLVTEDEEVYYERERGLIRRMKGRASTGPCRINEGNKEKLIIGESDFLLSQERALIVELMKKRHRAYAFSDEERDRLDVDKIPMIRIHTLPHEPWNLRGARYPNPDEKKKVVDYLDGKISTHVADYSSGLYASPWFCFIKPNGTLCPHITQPYIDDLAVKGPAVKESDEVLPRVRRFVWKHIQDLEKVLSLLEEHNLTASGAKSRHCMREATILGFVYSEKDRRPDVKKTDKITEWPVPFHSVTDVRSFLGTCGFWRAFVKNFVAKTEHLRKLVRQDQEWVWGEEQEEVVSRMKEEFREGGLVLGAPDYDVTETRPFIVETDAGPTALGWVLIQADMEGKERPLRFESRTPCTIERSYSQFKRETLAVLHCLRIFRNYIFGRRFILRVDSTALTYSLRNYVPSDPTVARWLTYIWMFNFELERIPGNKNRADELSRINWDSQEGEAIENTPPVDGFLDQEEDVRGHRGVQVTYAKISELYYWDEMMDMIGKFCRSCVPCQERSRLRQGEPLHPRLEREVGAVVHLDLLFMPLGDQGYNYIFDAHDNLSGFVDGRVIRTKTGPILVSCIEKYYLRYPFLREFVMDRGSEFTCQEVQELLSRSDFTKTVMPRGGKGTRPPRRPLGASGRYERHGPRHRESTPVYDDGDIELFLYSFWAHARRMGWTVTQVIERLRGADRFEEPIARICREATTRPEMEMRMQELRPSPVGPDGRPIRLEIGNAADFIPAFEWFMQGQGTPRDDWARTRPLWTRKAERPLARQIKDMARDWESCRAHLREAFRRPESPRPRVERRQRSRRQRDPEPSEASPSRGGRKALTRREEESKPEVEERGAYPECGLGPVEFHNFTEGGLRRSPVCTQEEAPTSEGPLRELKAHLDVFRWETSPRGEERGGQAKEVPQEEVPREEARDTQGERRLGDEGRRAGKEVIEVGEDTPPRTPAVGLRPGDTPGSTRQAEEGLHREEAPMPLSEKAPSSERRAERRRETAVVRREALALIDRHLATHALEHSDLEEPAPAEPRQELCQPEKEVEAEIPKRVDYRTRERAPVGETTEEKRARRSRRIEEIWQERQRLEAAGTLLEQQQERQRLKAVGALPEQPQERQSKGERGFLLQQGLARKAEERLDRKIRFLAKTSFDRYLMVESHLAGKKMKEEGHGLRLETMEVEIQELRTLVASQAAIIEGLRQQLQGGEDKAESSRQGEQRQPGQGLSGQPSAAEPRQESPIGRVILEPEEAKAKREAQREAFEFRAPTELVTLPIVAADPVMPLAVEQGLPPSSSEPAQGSAEGSMDVLLEAVHTMQEETSLFSPEQRIEEPLEREMGIETEGVIEGGPQRLDTP
ncbi:hypothetical protein CBR_g35049 [Chara braunii]|uniref:Integrase catalytic domain-containing protein n=1 Tax=Chara braunii TaxID=69332 RepID=A0A388LK32_CHABU|nr:hypothetical protein CBR_g35049 [Chara braunii]|eukprot:GBG82684.1 hypothetical protein CBR_g35049 [Chara braunii]